MEVKTMITEKEVLDACCGGKHWWFNKNDEEILGMDIRQVKKGVLEIQPNWSVEPEIISSYCDMPFNDETFSLIIWDIPHKLKKDNGLITKKYGFLGENWKKETQEGFNECWRVLRKHGTLIFKWSDLDVKVSEMLNLFHTKPKAGTITKKGVNNTYFLIFYKSSMDSKL
jgi:SAM-dependent methyltransferase